MEAKLCAGSGTGMCQTVKLYEDESHLKNFDAVVISCEPDGDCFEVVVDKTAFFPEGGGQNADRGTLGGVKVLDVKERNGIVYHRMENALAAGAVVRGVIDWERRFDYMQQHSGEHIVSGIVHRMFGYDNVGFHLGDAIVTLDFNGMLTQDDVDAVEWEANRAVAENREIIVTYPDREQLETMDYRSKIAIDGQVRIVTVDGYDICACCAPHVHRTGEIGMIKVTGCQKYKGGVRVSIACGFRALWDARIKQRNISEISVLLSAKPEAAAGAVKKLHQDMQTVKYQLGAVQEKFVMAKVAALASCSGNVCLFEDALENVAMRKAVNVMIAQHDGYCGVFSGNDEKGYKFLIGCGSGDARTAMNALKAVFECRGGGSREMVQGQIAGDGMAIEKAFKAIYEQGEV